MSYYLITLTNKLTGGIWSAVRCMPLLGRVVAPQLPRTQEHNGPLLRRPESHLAGIRALGMRLRPHTRRATSNHPRP